MRPENFDCTKTNSFSEIFPSQSSGGPCPRPTLADSACIAPDPQPAKAGLRRGALFCFLLFTLLISGQNLSFAWSGKNAFESYGDITQIALPAGAALWTVHKKDYKGALQLGEAFALAQGTTLLLKNTIKEERPDGGDQSFPSGHTMAAFTGAAFLDERYDIKTKHWFYGAAGLVGVSRVTSDRHWTHDVLAGALIGILSNKLLVKPLGKEKLALVPFWDGKSFYARLSIGF